MNESAEASFACPSPPATPQERAPGPARDSENPRVITITRIAEIAKNSSYRLSKDGKTEHVGHVHEVFATGDNYAVYNAEDGGRLYYSLDIGAKEPKDFNEVWTSVLELNGLPIHNLTSEERENVLSRKAGGISAGLDGDIRRALDLLSETGKFIEQTSSRVSRGRYLVGAIAAAVGVFAVATVYLPSEMWDMDAKPARIVCDVLAVGGCGGAIGAALSVAGRAGTALHFEPYARRWPGVMSGALRIAYGCLSAVVAVLAFDSGILTTPLITASNRFPALLLVGCLGGFGERWAEDVVTSIRSSIQTKPGETDGHRPETPTPKSGQQTRRGQLDDK